MCLRLALTLYCVFFASMSVSGQTLLLRKNLLDNVQLEEGPSATPFEDVPAATPGLPVFRVQPFAPQPNLLPNASFEAVEQGRPRGWHWHQGPTDASAEVDDTFSHSGDRSMRLTNQTPRGPHIFGSLNVPDGIPVKPETTYTLSCYVKGDRLGMAWFGGGKNWLVRALFPRETRGRWMRVVLPFTTEKDTTRIPVMLITESPTEPFWVDDVQLVEGTSPAPVLSPKEARQPVMHLELPVLSALRHRGAVVLREWNPTRYPRSEYHFVPRSLEARGWLVLPKTLEACRLVAILKTEDGRSLMNKVHTGRLEAGTYLLSLGAWVADLNDTRVRLGVRLEDVAKDREFPVLAEAALSRRLVTATGAEERLARVKTLGRELQRRIDAVTDKGGDPAYLVATRTVLNNFVRFAREDLEHDELDRAYDAAVEMESIAQEALSRTFLPSVPRYQTAATRPSFRLEGPAQLGTVRWPDGRREEGRPIQFVGVGHFGQVKHDIEILNDYGMNIIQIEFGPRSVVVGEDRTDTRIVDQYLKYLDRAARADVAVNLLLSPHYFPQWAYEKWPHLKDAGGGFLKCDVHAPEARAVFEKFLRAVIPKIADHPALHSLCLSNEPVFPNAQKSQFVRRRWHAWLAGEHGTVEALNGRWGSDYRKLEDVPIPDDFDPTPLVYDFVRFNQEAFAEFHAWMASIIRQMAPDVPLHAKIMMHAHFGNHLHGPWSISPELFAAWSDFHGNDDCKFFQPEDPWANAWVVENAGYDFQRSMADLPIFNSENHLFRDRNFDFVPPVHITNVFWQGAVHGQSATTTWVWERTYSHTADAAGSILHRPACAEAMGHAGLDLMRLAPEVTALQNIRPQVALVWSLASVSAGPEYIQHLQRTYEALNFCGLRIGFITERQLARYVETGRLPGPLSEVKLLIAPGVVRAPESMVTAFARFRKQGGRVWFIGKSPRADAYGRPLATPPAPDATIPLGADAEAMFNLLEPKLSALPLKQPVRLCTPDGRPAWGVEYLTTRADGRLLVNLCNYLQKTQTVRVQLNGKPVTGRDLLHGREVGPEIELTPLEPMLLEVNP